ncbi:PTS ascorbate transporter subunit IIC [Actinomycetaceae bacterium TAE3-ERU4]|nr:PTS ascorbate transporter subunit IIC [Actinomycetaceae bacterium TAE3-ERU4]
MNPVLQFIIQLVQIPAIIVGFIALLGLLLQKKEVGQVVTGTVKTVLSLLIIGGGITVLINALVPIQKMFAMALPSESVTTFVTFDEAVVSAVQSNTATKLGTLIGLTLLFGYMFHLLISRITSQRYVYLTGHMIWVHAGGFAILFYSLGLPNWAVVLVASLVDGAYMTFAPAMAQPFMRKITGTNDVAFAHGQTILNVAAAGLGKLIGDPKKSTEHINVPKKLNFFRDVAVSTTIVMFIVSFIAAVGAVIKVGVAGLEGGENPLTGGQNWIVFTLLQALGFTAGMLIMLYGVRMLIAEIVPAFEGIGRKVIPNAKPALDVPVIFPFAPNALIIGLISGFLGQILGMVVLALIGLPMPIPSVIVAFFACGAGAIFANATGGVRGAWAGGFMWGFVGWILISVAYYVGAFGDLTALGASSLGFTVPDVIIPGLIVHFLFVIGGKWVATAVPVILVLALVAIFWQPRLELPKAETENTENPADAAASSK